MSKHSALNAISKWFGILQLCLNVMNKFVHMVESEAREAKRKMIIMLIAAIFFLMFLISTWLCFTAMIFMYLVSLNLGFTLSLFFVLILNILLLTITGLIILNTRHNLFFPKTRKLLFHDKK